jgi:AraC-like DNA-binding protein
MIDWCGYAKDRGEKKARPSEWMSMRFGNASNRNGEWSRYYHDLQWHNLDVLHARFIEHRYARHSHDYFVIALVENGTVSYWYRGAQRVATAGQVFVVNPDEPHTGESAAPGGYVYRVLYPRVPYLAEVAADAGMAKGEVFCKESVLQDQALARLLSGFHKRFVGKGSAALCESLLLRALARLTTNHCDPQVSPRAIGWERPAIRTACDYIQAHFADDVPVSKLAELVCLSPYYFARAFEKGMGLPPHAYLETVRIRKAREFLDLGQAVVATALAVGYVDQSHFTHRFKRFLGVTPGQYAQNSKIRQARS